MKVAIVEDDINMRKSIEISLKAKKKYDIVSYRSAIEAIDKLEDDVDILIVDINMPKMDGITFLKKLNGKYDAIIITGNATLNLAIEAVRITGAKDFIRKPFEIDTLIKSIENISKARDKISLKPIKSKPKSNDFDFLIKSKSLQEAINLSNKVAKTNDITVLLLGDSGVGKEVFTRYIHKNSSRANAPLIAVNMAGIPDNLIESELFGYEKGAFTDAKESKMGKFELANGGTLFLDEIGEMPIDTQAKLLRAIQEKEIQRLGSQKTIKIDIRIISATNASLLEKIENKEFREDLYYRLNTFTIKIPPLRDRVEEIIPIANNIVKNIVEENGFGEKVISKEAQKELLKYDWPGNIRELISVVTQATIISDEKEIQSKDLLISGRKQYNERL